MSNIRKILVGVFSALTIPFGVMGALYLKAGDYWQAALCLALAMLFQYFYCTEKPYWTDGKYNGKS